jgi:fimbrial chaperone protein
MGFALPSKIFLRLVLLPCCFAAGSASAASLEVAPVLLQVTSPGAATTVTLRNSGAHPIATQTRVFRWIQEGGNERLEPTADVVASPPAAELRPGQDYVVRVVRLAQKPVEGEEAYRLLIDELPEVSHRPLTVNFVVRHVLPLFFDASDSSAPEAAWRVTQKGRNVTLTATNAGDRRIRLAEVKIGNGAKSVSFGPGLAGYALGHSSMSWTAAASGPALPSGAKVTITGQTEEGPFDVQAVVQRAP